MWVRFPLYYTPCLGTIQSNYSLILNYNSTQHYVIKTEFWGDVIFCLKVVLAQ